MNKVEDWFSLAAKTIWQQHAALTRLQANSLPMGNWEEQPGQLQCKLASSICVWKRAGIFATGLRLRDETLRCMEVFHSFFKMTCRYARHRLSALMETKD